MRNKGRTWFTCVGTVLERSAIIRLMTAAYLKRLSGFNLKSRLRRRRLSVRRRRAVAGHRHRRDAAGDGLKALMSQPPLPRRGTYQFKV